MDSNIIKNYLRGVSLFSVLPSNMINDLSKICIARTYPKGATIFKEGDSGHSLFMVTLGKIEIYKSIGKENPIRLASLTEGDVFGEVSLLAEIPRSATCISDSESQAIEIESTEFMKLLAQDTDTAYKFTRGLAKILSQRLSRLDEEYIKHMTDCPNCKEIKIKEFISFKEKMFREWTF